MTMKKVVIQSEYDPEYQEEIEQIVLGSVLLDKNILPVIGAEFQAHLFSSEKHLCIAETIIKLNIQNKPVDLVLITDALMKEKKLEKAGGIAYISSLTSKIGSTVNIDHHLRLLQQFFLARFINDVCNEAQVEIISYKKDVFEVYNDLQVKLEGALKDLIKTDIQDIGTIQKQLILDSYENQNKGGLTGVPTGLTRVDKLTNGWQKSDLIIVAGRPGMGKTALALSMLVEPSINQKIPTAIFSLEMSRKQLASRLNSINSGINVGKVVKGQLNYDEITHMELKNRSLYDSPLYIDDSPGLTIMGFKSKARKLVREKGVQLIVIDYLQLMKAGFRTDSREQEIAEISKSLKEIAKELDIPIIALSQLSRSVEQRGGSKVPMLSDLRESGQIEQDADMIVFCYRPEYYGFEDYEWGIHQLSTEGLFVFIVAKHRNGGLGEIPLEFVHEQTWIRNHPEAVKWYNDTENKNQSFSQNIPQDVAIPSKPLPTNKDFDSPSISGTKDQDNTQELEDFFNSTNKLDGTSSPYNNNSDICDQTPF
jgi:replicative DNA helicase